MGSRIREQARDQALHEMNFREGSAGWFMAHVESDFHLHSHAIPDDDLRVHEVYADRPCWCRPVVNEYGTFMHNALDGREAFETGERLPS